MTADDKPEEGSGQIQAVRIELVQPRTGNEFELGYQPPKAELQPPTPPVTQASPKPPEASNNTEKANEGQS